MRIRELAAVRVSYGYRRLRVLLRREGWKVNHNLVDRIFRKEGLEVRMKRRRMRVVVVLERLAKGHGLPRVITTDNGTEFTSRAVDERPIGTA